MTTANSTLESTAPDTASTYENVGRQAWMMLWIAFASFLLLLTGIPLAVNWYLNNATVALPAQVETIRGATLVMESAGEEPTVVIDLMAINEGNYIRTNEIARANVSIYAAPDETDPLTTVQLRNNSELVVTQISTPRFARSSLPQQVTLQLNEGRARITGNPGDEEALAITVRTPQSEVRLGSGSAAIAVSEDVTEVIARSGQVEVEAQDTIVLLEEGRRTTIAQGEPPGSPQATSRNLVVNGDFSQALADTWQVESLVDAGDLSNVTYGEVSLIESGGRQVAYFVREGEEGVHTETSLLQEINTDVQDFDSLVLRLDVRLISQSLPGAGILSSEFPLMVRIDFTDIDGNPQFWTWGFYAIDPVANWPIRDGEKVPEFVWYEYESPDFLNSPTFPRPQTVDSIRVYASGHNYRSQVSDIGLFAE